jgi:diadenosine tetraphosphate (Ap4A) HIT family hydrolase
MKDICKFCEKIEKDRIILETSEWIAFYDAYPVTKGHVLLVSKEHFNTFFDLPDRLKDSLLFRINDIKEILDNKFHPDGYNIGCNCGEAAGQTINHFHLHIIPRYKGDCENPRGGVRGVIPLMQNY